MSRLLFMALMAFGISNLSAQGIDKDLLAVKARLDSIEQYQASLSLDIDASFIKMPTKYAEMNYRKREPVSFTSDDFLLIPKRGLDVMLNQLFEHPFITVDRGMEEKYGGIFKVLTVIPENDKTYYTIAKLFLDTANNRISAAEISTKNEGNFRMQMDYKDSESILPDRLVIIFELQRLRIPFNFLGKDTEINRKELRASEVKEGRILLQFDDYRITRAPVSKT